MKKLSTYKIPEHIENETGDVPIGFVYITWDYSKFEFMKHNRELRQVTIDEMRGLANDGKFNPIDFPLIVLPTKSGKLRIVDGQHHFLTCIREKYPVTYIVAQLSEPGDVAEMNRVGKIWDVDDHAHFHSIRSSNRADYIKYRQYAMITGLSAGATSGILQERYNFGGGGKSLKSVREGKLKLSAGNYVASFTKYLFELAEISIKGLNKASNVQALFTLCRHKDFDWERFYKKVEKLGGLPEVEGVTGDNVLKAFVDLYNTRLKPEEKLVAEQIKKDIVVSKNGNYLADEAFEYTMDEFFADCSEFRYVLNGGRPPRTPAKFNRDEIDQELLNL